jgi:hypothetical protein
VDDSELEEEEAEETDDKEATVHEEIEGISGWRALGSLVANCLRRTYMSMYALRDPAPGCPETEDCINEVNRSLESSKSKPKGYKLVRRRFDALH